MLNEIPSPREDITVLITGFGPFLNIPHNPSSLILPLLPSTLTTTSIPKTIRLINPLPLPAIYTHLYTQLPHLLSTHAPDIVIHIGLATNQSSFSLEASANREGYHEIPDEDRRVVMKKFFPAKPKLPATLSTSFPLGDVLLSWKSHFSQIQNNTKANTKTKSIDPAKGKGKKEVDLMVTDNVGNYVCGWLYYISLLWFWKKKGSGSGSGNVCDIPVVFLHVPFLEGEEELRIGRDVVLGLVEALVQCVLS